MSTISDALWMYDPSCSCDRCQAESSKREDLVKDLVTVAKAKPVTIRTVRVADRPIIAPPTHSQPWLQWRKIEDQTRKDPTKRVRWVSSTESRGATFRVTGSIGLEVCRNWLKLTLLDDDGGDDLDRVWSRELYQLHDVVDAMVFAEDRAVEWVTTMFGGLLAAPTQAWVNALGVEAKR